MVQRYLTILFFISLLTPCFPHPAGKPAFKTSSTSGFIENKGQIIDQHNQPNPAVLFLLNTPGFNVQLRKAGFSYDLYTATGPKPQATGKSVKPEVWSLKPDTCSLKPVACSLQFHRIDIDLLNANPNPVIETSEPSPEYFNYFTSSASSEGITNVRQFDKITYKGIYPGIDLEFFRNEEQGYKYNFVIHPGGNIQDIRLKIEGPDYTSLSQDTLKFGTRFGDIEELIPESYLQVNDSKSNVKAHFRKIRDGMYGFSIDQAIPENSVLVIDPTSIRLWCTYYGGSAVEYEGQCSSDGAGNVYLAGSTYSPNNIATAGSFQNTLAGSHDGFLAKFNAAGQRQWGTYFGGGLYEDLGSCVVSNSGSIYVSGNTSSSSGIATAGAHQTVYGGGAKDCYIEKFDQAGIRFWGTYYGGAGSDAPGYMTVDKHGNVFLTGSTTSDTGIASPGSWQQNRNGAEDAFLAKFDSNSVRQWGTYFGGELYDGANDCTTDSTGNIYIAGNTASLTNIASPGAHQVTYEGFRDCFLAKFTTGGQRLWSTYYGGDLYDNAFTCSTDNLRNIYLSGVTYSSIGIATAGSHQPGAGGGGDAFLVKFDSLGVRQWGTYYGGINAELAYSCTSGWNNEIFMAGYTSSDNNISTTGSYQAVLAGSFDGFLVKFNAAGVRQWGTYYGGSDYDEILKCRYVRDDTLYLSGTTYSASGIASPGAHQAVYGGARDAMLVKFVECWPIAAAGPITGPATLHRNSGGIPYSVPSLAHAVEYVWTLPPGATIASGAGTDSITVNFSGIATTGDLWVKGMNKCGPGDSAFLHITVLPEFFSVGFIAPDTTCINHTINIIDTTTSGTTYYWNFCSGNANNDPTGINIGNPGGLLSLPGYITLVKQNDSCFSFISCQGIGVVRYYHGSSFRNNPVSWTYLGNFGGLIGPNAGGIQMKFDNGNWYGFVNSNTTLIRLNFRRSPVNAPTATDMGPFSSFNMAQGLVITKEGSNWIGLVTCSTGQNLIRLNFGNTLANNSPAVTDFGSLGGVLISPGAICLDRENSVWYVMIMAGGNTLARIAFGTSLLNAPTGVNLGNPGGFNSAGGLTLLRDCGSATGYWTNNLVNGQLGKLTFPTGISGTVSGNVLGNIGGLNQPQSFSELFRQNDTLYAYITDHGNGTLTRLTFPPCNNAPVPSSTLFNPPPYSYNQTGTYTIHLIVNEGSPAEGTVCKPIVIVDPPTVNLGPDDSICPVATKILNAGAGFSSYLWSTGATTQAITITMPGTYWVNATKWGCTATDSIHIIPATWPVISISGNTVVYQGNTEVYTTEPGKTGYTWTFSSGGTLVSGGAPTDNTITIQWNSVGIQWVRVNYAGPNGCTAFLPTQLNVNVIPTIWFNMPDTICITQPVNVVNNTIGGTTYFWNFCSGNANTNPTATDIGNPQGTLHQPAYITLVKQGTDCFSFTSNQVPPGVSRHYHGTSFSNDPVSSINFGSFGLLVVNRVEGIQVKNDNGMWYGFVNNNTNIVRLDFGTSLWNTPTATTIPVAGMNLGCGLIIIKEGTTWLGFLDNGYGNNLFRLNFGDNLSNPNPAVENLGNDGSFSHPLQMQLLAENGIWYLFVENAYSNSITRINFGSSLLNTPTGVNLGNPGGLNSPEGISIFKDCNSTTGYFTNWVNNGEIGRLTFTGGLAGTLSGIVLPYLGIYNHPCCFSELVRENDSLFLYLTIFGSSELVRLTFPPCNNASPSFSTLFTPLPVSYNQPGTYNIQLFVDEGLASAGDVCKQVAVMDPPTVNLGNDGTICPGGSKILNAGAGFSSYLWSNGATTQTITVNSAGTYWVNAGKWGCTASDTVHITMASAPIVNLGNDTIICSGSTITLNAGACSGCTYQWSNLTSNQMNIGNGQTFITGTAAEYMVTVVSPNSCLARDTVWLSVEPSLPVSVIITASSNPFCTGVPVIFTAYATNGGIVPSYQWKVNGMNAGPDNSIYSFVPNNGDVVSCVLTSDIPCTTSNPATSDSITMIENTNVTVSISISPSANPVCAGTMVTYTAFPVNGGTIPVLQWKLNGIIVGSNNPVFSYVPANGDVITCTLTSNALCASGNPATSSTVTMIVNPNEPVSITISPSANPVCAGTLVTFTASPTNPGTLPVYQWKVNGGIVGTNNLTYSYIPVSGDQVSCTLTSNAICPTGNPATSNTIAMTVNANLPVSVSIVASNNPVCTGIPVTFTATPVNGGLTPVYHWKVNGINTGTNSTTYQYTPANGDIVNCILTSSVSCPIGNPATSNSIMMNISSLPVVTFTICFDSITTTNAQPFKLKGGIPLGGIYSGAGVTNGIFYPVNAGTGTHQITYTYTNVALCSANASVTIVTIVTPVTNCGQPFIDMRDGKSYQTVKIGNQCWMASNLNYGTMIPANSSQRDNCIAEKYCPNDITANCGLLTADYQWDEIMNYGISLADQGLCPPGWHVPSEADWNILFAEYTNNGFAGSPLKYSGFSGFNALLNGALHLNEKWDYAGFATFFWSSTSHSSLKAWTHGMNDPDPSVSAYPAFRTNAFSVRCLKDY